MIECLSNKIRPRVQTPVLPKNFLKERKRETLRHAPPQWPCSNPSHSPTWSIHLWIHQGRLTLEEVRAPIIQLPLKSPSTGKQAFNIPGIKGRFWDSNHSTVVASIIVMIGLLFHEFLKAQLHDLHHHTTFPGAEWILNCLCEWSKILPLKLFCDMRQEHSSFFRKKDH
jgi:hypothetical protein